MSTQNIDTAAGPSLLQRTESLLQMALDAGAGEAEVCGYGGTSLSAKMEKGDLGQVQADEGTTLGVRVVVDGKLGFASTNQADDGSLRNAARDAVAIANMSPADEANVLPAPRAFSEEHLLSPHVDKTLATIGVDEVVERAKDLSDQALAVDSRLSIDQASFRVVAAETAIVSSRGIRALDRDAALTMSLMGLANDGDDTGGMDYRGAVVRQATDVDAELARLAREVGMACIGNLGATAASTYKGPVLFAPAAFSSVFLGSLIGGVSAIAVQRGRSALADKLDTPIAAGMNVYDNPTNRKASGACAFDREGLPATRFPIVEDGVLKSYLHNAYSAAVGNTQSTGHAQGGPRGVPGLGVHAIVVEATQDDLADEEACLKALGTGLYIQRFSGSVDPASGDFSGTAKSARWVENGEITRSVNEVMLAGNAFDLLKDACRLSTAQEWVGGSSSIPWALVDRLSVTAG